MFEHLKKWSRILVVGPQRSGTRIAATMIAHDTDYWFVGEEEIGVDSLNRLWKILQISHRIVVQCPALTCYAHLLARPDPGLCVVMMRRDLDDIKASEERIFWKWEPTELIRMGVTGGNSAQLKYQRWNGSQKADLGAQGYEVEYSSLEQHGLWIAKPARGRFGPRQTS